jgi:hypothetical protein
VAPLRSRDQPWTLEPDENGVASVFVRYRDTAANVSAPASGSVRVIVGDGDGD